MTEEKENKTDAFEKCLDKKPDKETELFRLWNIKNDKINAFKEDDCFKIKYKEMELGLVGFNIARNKKTNALIFAYKFRHDKKMILFYTPTEEGKKIFNKLKEEMPFIFEIYKLQDMEETLKSIYYETKNIREEK